MYERTSRAGMVFFVWGWTLDKQTFYTYNAQRTFTRFVYIHNACNLYHGLPDTGYQLLSSGRRMVISAKVLPRNTPTC